MVIWRNIRNLEIEVPHTNKVPLFRVLIASRLWNRTVLSNRNSTLRHLSSLSSLSTSRPAADTCYGYFELLLRAAMAAHWISGEEGIVVAHTRRTWSLVDRSSN